MKALVVHESMFGNTEKIARAIADGLAGTCEVTLADVSTAPAAEDIDLLVAGAPTHAFGLSRPSSRQQAEQNGTVRPGAASSGLREYLAASPPLTGVAAATFDTRVDKPITGSAARKATACCAGWAAACSPRRPASGSPAQPAPCWPARRTGPAPGPRPSPGRSGPRTRPVLLIDGEDHGSLGGAQVRHDVVLALLVVAAAEHGHVERGEAPATTEGSVAQARWMASQALSVSHSSGSPSRSPISTSSTNSRTSASSRVAISAASCSAVSAKNIPRPADAKRGRPVGSGPEMGCSVRARARARRKATNPGVPGRRPDLADDGAPHDAIFK